MFMIYKFKRFGLKYKFFLCFLVLLYNTLALCNEMMKNVQIHHPIINYFIYYYYISYSKKKIIYLFGLKVGALKKNVEKKLMMKFDCWKNMRDIVFNTMLPMIFICYYIDLTTCITISSILLYSSLISGAFNKNNCFSL